MTGHRQSFARTRVRRRFDYGRMAEALRRPGIDTRTWVGFARVDEDPEGNDSVVWDEELGWLCDVTFVGGELDGEGPVLARYSPDAAPERGRYSPPREGCLCVVLVPLGDPNNDVNIVHFMHDDDACFAPTMINGDDIVERDAEEGQVAALETHMAVYPQEDADEEWRERRVTTSGRHRLHGESMELGVDGADQPYVRGANYADSFSTFLDALDAFAQAIAVAPTTAPANVNLDPATLEAFQLAIENMKQAREQYLSKRITGD